MDTVRSVQMVSEIWGAVTCAIMLVFVAYYRHADRKGAAIFVSILANNCLLCASDAFALGFRGNETAAGFVIVRVSNFLVFFCSIMMGILVSRYIDFFIGEKDKTHSFDWLVPVYVLTAIDISLLVISQFTGIFYSFDEQNRYYRGELYAVFMMIGLVVIIYIFTFLIRNRKKLSRLVFACFMIYSMIPFVTVIMQILHYGYSFSAFGYTICQIMLFISFGARYAQRLLNAEKKNSEERIKRLRAQISPHFIFNSLTSLQELCLEDPQKASDGIKQFSRYLRGNLEALSSEELIPFSQELSYIREYVYLENLDPSRNVDITYELETTDFMVPVLSVEPIVENAVQHGIAYKAEGKIVVRSYVESGFIYVSVEDNGVGESTVGSSGEKRRGVALTNVKERLSLQCNGFVNEENLDPGRRVSVCLPV